MLQPIEYGAHSENSYHKYYEDLNGVIHFFLLPVLQATWGDSATMIRERLAQVLPPGQAWMRMVRCSTTIQIQKRPPV